MRIAIFGTGGAGGYFGARLAQSGEDVVFIARGSHLQAIRDRGLHVETHNGSFVVSALATDKPAEAGVVDVIIVGVKAWQVQDAARAMQPMLGPHTAVLPLQNGVEAASQLGAVLGESNVLGGLCGTVSFVVGPGKIRSVGQTNFVKFGELRGAASDRCERLKAAFVHAGIPAEIPRDIEAALWEKFLFVVSWGGIGAVARAPIGVLRSLAETRLLLEQAMREIFDVARARRLELHHEIVAKTMAFVDSLSPGATTSLQRDIADGKPSELEAWNGAVVRLGREAGVPTPLHAVLYSCLRPQALQGQGDLSFPA